MTDLKRLGQGLAAIANWLQEDSTRYSDTVAMEVATAILLLQNAQENFKRLGTDFAQQVDLMVARLYACIAGRPAAADEEIPLLDEMTRRAQEKLLISQVAREIQNNLAQVEQALDAFFRDPAKAHDLSGLNGQIKQIGGRTGDAWPHGRRRQPEGLWRTYPAFCRSSTTRRRRMISRRLPSSCRNLVSLSMPCPAVKRISNPSSGVCMAKSRYATRTA